MNFWRVRLLRIASAHTGRLCHLYDPNDDVLPKSGTDATLLCQVLDYKLFPLLHRLQLFDVCDYHEEEHRNYLLDREIGQFLCVTF